MYVSLSVCLNNFCLHDSLSVYLSVCMSVCLSVRCTFNAIIIFYTLFRFFRTEKDKDGDLLRASLVLRRPLLTRLPQFPCCFTPAEKSLQALYTSLLRLPSLPTGALSPFPPLNPFSPTSLAPPNGNLTSAASQDGDAVVTSGSGVYRNSLCGGGHRYRPYSSGLVGVMAPKRTDSYSRQ